MYQDFPLYLQLVFVLAGLFSIHLFLRSSSSIVRYPVAYISYCYSTTVGFHLYVALLFHTDPVGTAANFNVEERVLYLRPKMCTILYTRNCLRSDNLHD